MENDEKKHQNTDNHDDGPLKVFLHGVFEEVEEVKGVANLVEWRGEWAVVDVLLVVGELVENRPLEDVPGH